MNKIPKLINCFKSSTGPIGFSYSKNSSLIHIISKVTVTIPPNSGANVETECFINLIPEMVLELIPSRNTYWKDMAFIRGDVFTSDDNCPVIVYVFNYSSSPIVITSGEEVCWGKFSTYIKTRTCDPEKPETELIKRVI